VISADTETTEIYSRVVVTNPYFRKFKLIKYVYLGFDQQLIKDEEIIRTSFVDYLDILATCRVVKDVLVQMQIRLYLVQNDGSLRTKFLDVVTLSYIITGAPKKVAPNFPQSNLELKGGDAQEEEDEQRAAGDRSLTKTNRRKGARL
jgi:hypothetical protein